MSILLVGADGDVGEAVVARLVQQGDEVRVIETDERASDRWRALGAHVARGAADDADLVERAAQNVRTVVVLGEIDVRPVVQGAAAAGVDRLVLTRPAGDATDVADCGLDYVVLVVPRTRLVRRRAVAAGALAEAIDAADDLAGNPKIVVDLGTDRGRSDLGLDAPSG